MSSLKTEDLEVLGRALIALSKRIDMTIMSLKGEVITERNPHDIEGLVSDLENDLRDICAMSDKASCIDQELGIEVDARLSVIAGYYNHSSHIAKGMIGLDPPASPKSQEPRSRMLGPRRYAQTTIIDAHEKARQVAWPDLEILGNRLIARSQIEGKSKQGDSLEQPAHPSEVWIRHKEAVRMYQNTFTSASDAAAKTAITNARKRGDIKGKIKESGNAFLVEKGSVMKYIEETNEARAERHGDGNLDYL